MLLQWSSIDWRWILVSQIIKVLYLEKVSKRVSHTANGLIFTGRREIRYVELGGNDMTSLSTEWTIIIRFVSLATITIADAAVTLCCGSPTEQPTKINRGLVTRQASTFLFCVIFLRCPLTYDLEAISLFWSYLLYVKQAYDTPVLIRIWKSRF